MELVATDHHINQDDPSLPRFTIDMAPRHVVMRPMLAEIYRSQCSPLECEPTGMNAVLPRMDGIRAVVFDIYGTLFMSGSGDIGVSAESQREQVLRQILREFFELEIPATVSLTSDLVGLIRQDHAHAISRGITFPEVEIRNLWTRLISPYTTLTQSEIEELALRYEVAVNPVWPMPNLRSSLDAIQQKGLKLGIVSNAQFYTPSLFPAFLGRQRPEFDPQLCIYSYQESHAKPGGHLYRLLAERLALQGIAPSEVLYVGNDMRNDVAPAAECGFRSVLFAGDHRSLRLRPEMNLPSPHAIVTDLVQIASLV